MLESQRESEMEGAARIPEELTYENVQKYSKQRAREEREE